MAFPFTVLVLMYVPVRYLPLAVNPLKRIYSPRGLHKSPSPSAPYVVDLRDICRVLLEYKSKKLQFMYASTVVPPMSKFAKIVGFGHWNTMNTFR